MTTGKMESGEVVLIERGTPTRPHDRVAVLRLIAEMRQTVRVPPPAPVLPVSAESVFGSA